ncbi:MAG: hypothetical protein EBR82_40885 [Caulobacteraceae bacterium]|nr:hypothetical protein [Caulobacteraceae bacterium]
MPQRRRRVFIVGSLGDGRCAQVLFEREGSSGNHTAIDSEELRSRDCPPDRDAWWDGGRVSQTLDAVLYKKQALPEKNRFPAVVVAPWVRCECCGDVWCRLHGMHAYDCACPAVDEWAVYDLSPYDPSVLRFITPTECERLQGFPDGWTSEQPDTTRYRQLGNAVTVPVAKWIAARRCRETH